MFRAMAAHIAAISRLSIARVSLPCGAAQGPLAPPAHAHFRLMLSDTRFSHAGRQLQCRAFTYEPAADYGIGDAVIEEVDFDPALANSISLIGTTGRDIEVKYLQSGNKVGTTGIAVNDRKGNAEWYQVELWGPLAERASKSVGKGTQVAVTGRLKVESWQDKATGQTRKAYKVVASSLKRVRPWRGSPELQQDAETEWGAVQQPQYQQQAQQWGSAANPLAGPNLVEEPPAAAAAAAPAAALGTTEELWMILFEKPSDWVDYRGRKASGQINAKFPDFKKKPGGKDDPSLWLNSKSTPAWVREELAKVDSQKASFAPY